MAREHRPDHRPLHPRGVLSSYPIFEIADGPWPGRLAFGPVPVGDADPAAIVSWGAAEVLGLTTVEEAAELGWPDLPDRLQEVGLPWSNAPIRDFGVPDPTFEAAWPVLRDRLLDRLAAGEKLFVHCRGGAGRSGMIVGALLVAGGVPAAEAVAAVRYARPGAIETPGQMAWLRGQNRALRSEKV